MFMLNISFTNLFIYITCLVHLLRLDIRLLRMIRLYFSRVIDFHDIELFPNTKKKKYILKWITEIVLRFIF